MLYRLFKWLFIPTVQGYFRSVKSHNLSSIPDSGPVIFSVNHTSAFMDPILFAVSTKRILYFLARGEAFNSKFSIAFYNQLNMLPVYRPETRPGDVFKNKGMFQKCFNHLKNGKAIMIFPEGFSQTGRRVRPIKSGIARIALGAEDQNDFDLNIKIIPIGLNYTDAHAFRSDVFINVGEPIKTASYKQLFYENEKEAYERLTEDVKKGMEACTINISDERLDKFVAQVEILHQVNSGKRKLSEDEAVKEFKLSRNLAKQCEELAKDDPEKFKQLELRLSNYHNRLNRLNLKGSELKQTKYRKPIWAHLPYLLLGLPIAILGIAVNSIPLKLTAVLSDKVEVREDFVGSLLLAGGMFIFLIFYLLIAISVGLLTNFFIAFVTVLLLYPAGLFSIYYVKRIYRIIEEFKHSKLFRTKSEFMAHMKREKQGILEELAMED